MSSGDFAIKKLRSIGILLPMLAPLDRQRIGCYRAALFMVEATAYSMDIGECRQGVHRLMSIKQPAVWSAGRDG